MTKDAPAVDILLATWNGERYLAEQIDSILAQSYPHWRLKIRDDGSTDGTRDIIRQYVTKNPERLEFIGRGASWENAYNENFNSQLRNGLLYMEVCYTVREAKVLIQSGRQIATPSGRTVHGAETTRPGDGLAQSRCSALRYANPSVGIS